MVWILNEVEAAMQVLTRGKSSTRKSWVGKIIQCANCSFSAKLQLKDKVRLVRGKHVDHCEVKCPDCKATMTLSAFPFKRFP